MNRYRTGMAGVLLAGLVGCTSLSEGEEGMPGVNQEQRVRYRADTNATLRDRMDEQSSEINRKRNIEEYNKNQPVMLPPEVRPERLPNAPLDTTKHTPRPVKPRKSGN